MCSRAVRAAVGYAERRRARPACASDGEARRGAGGGRVVGKAGTAAPGETPRATLARQGRAVRGRGHDPRCVPARDPRRAASHLNHQSSAGALRDELGAAPPNKRGVGPAGPAARRRRPGSGPEMNRRDVEGLGRPARGRGVERRSRGRAAAVVTERIQAEIAAEDQRAAAPRRCAAGRRRRGARTWRAEPGGRPPRCRPPRNCAAAGPDQ